MTVYIDIYFLLNTMMNMTVLFLSSKLTGENLSFLRLTAGSFLGGALASFAVVFIPQDQIRMAASVIILFIMSIVTFGGKTLRIVLKNVFFTLMISAQMSGIQELFTYFLSYGGKPLSALVLISLTFPFILISVIVFRRYLKRKLELISCDTVISLKNCKDVSEFKALYDSGNLLKDPYSGSPVILMTSKAFSRFLSDDADIHTAFSDPMHLSGKNKLLPILIPISKCGGKTELITGFRTEYVLLKRGGIIKNDIFTRNITVGILTDVSDFSGFECLLPAEII